LKLCEYNHNFKYTFQFNFWDVFKQVPTNDINESANLAELLGSLIGSGALGLTVLKTVEFQSLDAKSLLFFRRVFTVMFTQYNLEQVKTVYERIAIKPEFQELREKLVLILKITGMKALSKKHDPPFDSKLKLAQKLLHLTPF
jgi:hypothetical protein